MMWFRKKAVPDLTDWVLGNSFPKFSVPEKQEGFDDVRYAWQKAEDCKAYLQKYVLKSKVLCRIEDLQPSDWFKTKWSEWQEVLARWHNKQSEFKIAKGAADKALEEQRKIAEAEKDAK